MKKIALAAALILGATIPFASSTSAAPSTCQLAGATDDGGYIDCGSIAGPVRITGYQDLGWAGEVSLLVDDADAYVLRLHKAPNGDVTGIVLKDSTDTMVAAGVAHVPSWGNPDVLTTVVDWSDGLSFTIACTQHSLCPD